MALRLDNVGEDLIKKLGRWSSSTWLTYIHAQISSLTAGLSERMVVHHVFYNVGSLIASPAPTVTTGSRWRLSNFGRVQIH